MTTYTTATVKLTNYTTSDYIPVSDGDVIIWKEHGYLGHTTNLTSYETYVDETRRTLDLFNKDHERRVIATDLSHIETLVETLRINHRHSRSINLLGTALKVVAGTPDFEDWEQIKFKQTQLIEAETKQIEINTRIQTRLNELTMTLNSIRDTDGNDMGHMYETILAKNRIIITDLQNLILALTLAKIDLISPVILDNDDINELILQHFTNISVADLLEVAKIKAFQNNEILYFLIKYPIPKLVCKKINIFPVSHGNIILNFENISTVADCGTNILAIDGCGVAVSSTFCKQLVTSNCAQQLVAGTLAQCSTRPGHLDELTLVDDGAVIINNAAANITDNAGFQQLVVGTYLLTFDDKVWINGTLFVNNYGVFKRKPVVQAVAQINITEHREHLSLPYLHELSLANLQHISQLRSRLLSSPAMSSSITLTLIVICLVAAHKIRQRRKRQKLSARLADLQASMSKPGDALNLAEGGVNAS